MLTDANNADEVLKDGQQMLPLGSLVVAKPIAAQPLFEKIGADGNADEGAEPLANQRHENFCQLMAYGDAEGRHYHAYEAYQEAFKDGVVSNLSNATARANASRLRREHPEIDKRIAFLDREIKRETMMHRGAVFAKTINNVNDVMEAMMKQKSNPKAAAVLINAANLILKATGNEQPNSVQKIISAEVTNKNGGAGEGGAGGVLDTSEVERKISMIIATKEVL